jgi:hypothetical protein
MSKGFDAVAWMRSRRTEIDEADRGLSWEDKARKTAEMLRNDPLWKRLRSRVAKPARGLPARKEPALQSRLGAARKAEGRRQARARS